MSLYDKFIDWQIKRIEKKSQRDAKKQSVILKREEKNLEYRKRKAEIRNLKIQYHPLYDKLVHLVTHKFFMYFILINCTIVEIFSMRAMFAFADLSALPVLITAVITESISYAIYCAKSYSGTKQEKIQELDNKRFELEKEIALNNLENNTDNTDTPTGGIDDINDFDSVG